MPVNDIVHEVAGPGGLDDTKPNRNIVERHVVVAEAGPEQTVEVRDGAGAPLGRTYKVRRNVEGENEQTIRSRIGAALTANAAYVAKATPTAAETTAEVKALTRQVSGLLRLVDGRLDSAD